MAKRTNTGRVNTATNKESRRGKEENTLATAPARSYRNTEEEPPTLKEKIPAVAYRNGALLANPGARPESQMTAIEKMEVTREGISKKALEQLKEKATLDYDQLATVLGVARATLIAKKGAERFSPALSEKVMSLADIYAFGYEVFGDQHSFNQWIFQPLSALGGKAPYDFLDNQFGREEVRNIIGRIHYGVYS